MAQFNKPDSVIRRRPLVATRYAVARTVRPGDLAIDATAGNGHDTELLARLVGRSGQVFGLDVQEEALRQTRRRLVESSLADRVSLHRVGHECLGEPARVPDSMPENVRCVTFNLGYLPGGDKSIVTRPETTAIAIAAAFSMIEPGGLVTVMVYPGHPGGHDEAGAVEETVGRISRADFEVARVEPTGNAGAAYAIHIRRRLAGQRG